MWGVYLSQEEANNLLDLPKEDEDDDYDTDIYEVFEDTAWKYHLTTYVIDGSEFFVGVSPQDIPENQTMADWKEEVQRNIDAFLSPNGLRIKECAWHKEAWYA